MGIDKAYFRGQWLQYNMADITSPNNDYVYIDLYCNKNIMNLLDNTSSCAELGVVMVVTVAECTITCKISAYHN